MPVVEFAFPSSAWERVFEKLRFSSCPLRPRHSSACTATRSRASRECVPKRSLGTRNPQDSRRAIFLYLFRIGMSHNKEKRLGLRKKEGEPMAESPRMLVQDLRRLVNPLRLEETDGQLLSAFADSQDQDAFEALVRRHGPPVFAICRRVIGQTSGADDAFQVTFFTLARKARSLRKQQAVGAWLYRVAHRVACRARIGEQRRRQMEAAMKNVPLPCASTNAQSGELLAALEAELAELPEKYRAPLLLCGVEEKTHEEAARILGQPLGSMSNLLARGRALLRQRLARRGFTIGAGTLALLNAANAQAMVPAVLLQATVRDALPVVLKSTIAGATAHLSPNVASLLKEALRAMFWTKGKLSVLFLTMGLICRRGRRFSWPGQRRNVGEYPSRRCAGRRRARRTCRPTGGDSSGQQAAAGG